MTEKFIAEGGVEVTDKLIEQWAEPWEIGEIPGIAGDFVSAPGRPRLSEESTQLIAFRLPVSVVKALDRKAKENGESRSQRLRKAVLADVLKP